jgi:hypothetical protein
MELKDLKIIPNQEILRKAMGLIHQGNQVIIQAIGQLIQRRREIRKEILIMEITR